MTLRLIEGFEGYGSDAGFNASGTWTANTFGVTFPVGRFGGNALRLPANNASGNLTTTRVYASTPLTGVLGAALRIEAPDAGRPALAMGLLPDGQTFNGTGGVMVLLDPQTNRVRLHRADTLALIQAGTTPVNPAAWQYIEIVFNSSTNAVQVFLNGVLECSGTVPVSAVTTAAFGRWTAGVPNSMDVDDVYALDGLGTTNNARLGDCRVETRFPTTNVDVTNWTTVGVAAAWDAVNDPGPPDGDTTHVTSQTVGATAMFSSTTALASNPETIFGVSVVSVARRADTGSRQAALVSSNGTQEQVGASVGLANGYQQQVALFETNPAGTAWTRATVEASRFGLRITV